MFSIQTKHLTITQKVMGLDLSVLTKLMLVLAGSLALLVSAKISIPFYPIPMTMQTFVVLIIGMTYGWKLGGATILLYLVEGSLGLPVFSATPERGIGLAYMVGPTGGYLLGFLLSTVTVGWLAQRGWDRKVLPALAAMTIGTTIIFLTGTIWLGLVIGWDKPILALGVAPFMLAAVLKIALAGATLPLVWKALDQRK